MLQPQKIESIITSSYDCVQEGIDKRGTIPHCDDETAEELIESIIPEMFEIGNVYTGTTRDACEACGMRICAKIIFQEKNGNYSVIGSLTKVK